MFVHLLSYLSGLGQGRKGFQLPSGIFMKPWAAGPIFMPEKPKLRTSKARLQGFFLDDALLSLVTMTVMMMMMMMMSMLLMLDDMMLHDV